MLVHFRERIDINLVNKINRKIVEQTLEIKLLSYLFSCLSPLFQQALNIFLDTIKSFAIL
jgi:hypothetical protein